MTAIEKALQEIALFLETNNIPYMVIGGIANIVWGSPRTTVDIDVTINVEDDKINSTIDAASQQFKCLVNKPTHFVEETRVLPLQTKRGVRIDLIFGRLSYEKDAILRAKAQEFGEAIVRICSAEDLIIHKIVSERPKDRDDVKELIAKRRQSLDRAYLDPIVEGLSKELDQPDILDFYRSCFSA